MVTLSSNICIIQFEIFWTGKLNTVCLDVEVEPPLQELEEEQFTRSSTLTGDQARPEIRARGFYKPGKVDFF